MNVFVFLYLLINIKLNIEFKNYVIRKMLFEIDFWEGKRLVFIFNILWIVLNR